MFLQSVLSEKHGTRKSHIFTQMLITVLPKFNQSLLDFFNIVDLQLIFTMLYTVSV